MQSSDISYTQIYSGAYAPIEQLIGSKQGAFSDIYAVGMTAYRAIGGTPVDALTRERALTGGSVDPLVPAIKLGAERYPTAFLNMIDCALRLRPAERPQSVPLLMKLLQVDEAGSTQSVMRPTAASPEPSDVGPVSASRYALDDTRRPGHGMLVATAKATRKTQRYSRRNVLGYVAVTALGFTILGALSWNIEPIWRATVLIHVPLPVQEPHGNSESNSGSIASPSGEPKTNGRFRATEVRPETPSPSRTPRPELSTGGSPPSIAKPALATATAITPAVTGPDQAERSQEHSAAIPLASPRAQPDVNRYSSQRPLGAPSSNTSLPQTELPPAPETQRPPNMATLAQPAVPSTGRVTPEHVDASLQPDRKAEPKTSTPAGPDHGADQIKTAQILDAQRRLTALGLDTGGIDGKVGAHTRASVLAFERATGLPPAGEISPSLLARLREPAPPPKKVAASLFDMASEARHDGQEAEAIRLYEMGLRLSVEPQALLALGDLNRDRSDTADARKAYRESQASKWSDREARYRSPRVFARRKSAAGNTQSGGTTGCCRGNEPQRGLGR